MSDTQPVQHSSSTSTASSGPAPRSGTTGDEPQPDRVRPLAVARFVAGSFALGVVAFVATLTVFTVVGALMHRTNPVVATSGSMSPAIATGDIVIIRSPDPHESIAAGSIVVFHDSDGTGYVTHRLHRGIGDGTYTTKGDANRRPDSRTITADEVVGVATLVVPYVGVPVAWYDDGRNLEALAAALAGLALLWLALSTLSPQRDPWARVLAESGAPTTTRRRLRTVPIPRHAPLTVLTILLLTNLLHTSTAAFADTNTKGPNTLDAAQHFPCSSHPTITRMTGFEHGANGLDFAAFLWDSSSWGTYPPLDGSVGVDGTVSRTGGYSYRMNKSSGDALWSGNDVNSNVDVGHFAIRFEALPTAYIRSFSRLRTSSGDPLNISYDHSSNRFMAGFGVSDWALHDDLGPVEADRWYVFNYRLDTSANPHAFEWQVDGVDAPTRYRSEAATTITSFDRGSARSDDVFHVYFDDDFATSDPSAYPLGDGRIAPLSPDAMGSHNNVGRFDNDDGTSINSNSWQRVGVRSHDTFVRQHTTGSGSYIGMELPDIDEACVRGVKAYIARSANSTSLTTTGKASLFVDGTERVVYDGNWQCCGIVSYHALVEPQLIAPVGSHWTPEDLNATILRFGYSTSRQPRLNMAVVEYITR